MYFSNNVHKYFSSKVHAVSNHIHYDSNRIDSQQ